MKAEAYMYNISPSGVSGPLELSLGKEAQCEFYYLTVNTVVTMIILLEL